MGRRQFDPRQFKHVPQSVRSPKASQSSLWHEIGGGHELDRKRHWWLLLYESGDLRTEADSLPNNVKKDWTCVDQYQSWAELWNYSNEGLQLSPYCDWHFVYLDEAYQKAFGGGVSKSTPHRSPLYVYSDAGQSMVTGYQVTDLLREIPQDPTKMYYEPKHFLYLPVHVEVMDIIKTQLA